MSIPIPPDLSRGRVSWTVGRTDGTTLPGARGTVRFEATAVAVTYSTATVLPSPVETPVVDGTMTPVDLLVNDPEVWNWRVTPRLGVTWEPFHIDVGGPVNLATAAVVPGKGPIRAVKGVKGDPGTATTITQVTGLAARLAALEYSSGLRNITASNATNDIVFESGGGLFIERNRNTVTLWVYKCRAAPGTGGVGQRGAIPTGFRPSLEVRANIPRVDSVNENGLLAAFPTSGLWVTMPEEGTHTGVFTWTTRQPAPTLPPGDPA